MTSALLFTDNTIDRRRLRSMRTESFCSTVCPCDSLLNDELVKGLLRCRQMLGIELQIENLAKTHI